MKAPKLNSKASVAASHSAPVASAYRSFAVPTQRIDNSARISTTEDNNKPLMTRPAVRPSDGMSSNSLTAPLTNAQARISHQIISARDRIRLMGDACGEFYVRAMIPSAADFTPHARK